MLGAEAIELHRPPKGRFDTIISTRIPEAGLRSVADLIVDGGRLLLIVPFGPHYPSEVVNALRSFSVPIDLELSDGQIRAAVDLKRPSVSAWQMVASPGRLLAMTERGASELEDRRTQEISALRSAYRRLAERLMTGAADKAAPSIATADRVVALQERVTDLTARLQSAAESTDARVGRALLQAARNPREALRLPARILSAYVDSRRAPPIALPAPPPIDREIANLIQRSDHGFAIVLDGRSFDEAIGIDRHLAMEGFGVLLGATRRPTDMRPAQKILRVELDLLAPAFGAVGRAEASPRLAIFRSPNPTFARWINRLNAWGFTTVYDCFEDWPSVARTGSPHRYSRAVERFIAGNADVVTAASEAVARMEPAVRRPPVIVDARDHGARCAAILTAVAKAPLGVEKQLHARGIG